MKNFLLKPIIPMILGFIILVMGGILVMQTTRWMWVTGIISLILGAALILFISITKNDLLGRSKKF